MLCLDEMKIERNKNWVEWKVEWMKIGIIISSFIVYGWREKWKEWKYKRSNFSLFGLIEKWEEQEYYMSKLHLYSHIPMCNLQTQFILFFKKISIIFF